MRIPLLAGTAAQLLSSRRRPPPADRRTNVWHEEHRCIAFIKRDMDTHKLSSQLIYGNYADPGGEPVSLPQDQAVYSKPDASFSAYGSLLGWAPSGWSPGSPVPTGLIIYY